MDNQPIPAYLTPLVEACISAARQELTRVGHLPPVAFIGRDGEKKTFIFPLGQDSREEEAAFIRQYSAHINADFVFIITEAWLFEPTHPQHYQETVKQYGSLESSPNSVECVWFMLETHAGTWCGFAELKPLADSSGKTFGEIEMRIQKKSEGVLTGFLSPQHNNGHVVH